MDLNSKEHLERQEELETLAGAATVADAHLGVAWEHLENARVTGRAIQGEEIGELWLRLRAAIAEVGYIGNGLASLRARGTRQEQRHPMPRRIR